MFLSSSRRDSRVHNVCPAGYSLHAYHVLERHLISRQRLGSSSYGSADRHIWNPKNRKSRKISIYMSSIKPVLRCVFFLNNRARGKTRTCRRRCTPGSVHSVDLLNTWHEIFLLDGPRGSRGFYLQFQPRHGFAAVRPFGSSDRSCGVKGLLRKEDAIICSVPHEVEGWCAGI